MDDAGIAQAFKHDFSAGTDAFREELLQHCLNVLASGGDTAGAGALPQPLDYRELDDAALDLLSAAGDAAVLRGEEPLH